VVPDEVIEQAAQMFLENGYYRTRMQDIADSFGVTHAALYYHFQNKHDILAQINTRALKELLGAAEEVARADLPPGMKLALAFRRHIEYVANNPAFVATFLEHDLEIPPRQLASITRMRRKYTDLMVDLYEEARVEGSVPDTNSWVAVSLLLGACNWIYRWYRPSQGMTPAELVEEGMTFLEPLLSSTAANVDDAPKLPKRNATRARPDRTSTVA
jgi:AcrR family transcriptional regulator